MFTTNNASDTSQQPAGELSSNLKWSSRSPLSCSPFAINKHQRTEKCTKWVNNWTRRVRICGQWRTKICQMEKLDEDAMFIVCSKWNSRNCSIQIRWQFSQFFPSSSYSSAWSCLVPRSSSSLSMTRIFRQHPYTEWNRNGISTSYYHSDSDCWLWVQCAPIQRLSPFVVGQADFRFFCPESDIGFQ